LLASEIQIGMVADALVGGCFAQRIVGTNKGIPDDT
jgi:hypothetical protein